MTGNLSYQIEHHLYRDLPSNRLAEISASSWPKNLLADPKARIEIGGTAANYLSRPATEDEVARNMPRLIEMWPAHDSHMEHNGVRHVIVFEPMGAES